MSARKALTSVSWNIPMKVPMALSRKMITRKGSRITLTTVQAATRRTVRHGPRSKRSLMAKARRRRSAKLRKNLQTILQLSYLWSLRNPRMLMQESMWGRWNYYQFSASSKRILLFAVFQGKLFLQPFLTTELMLLIRETSVVEDQLLMGCWLSWSFVCHVCKEEYLLKNCGFCMCVEGSTTLELIC